MSQSAATQQLNTENVHLALRQHVGKRHGVGIGNLVFEATGEQPSMGAERRCRKIISELREEGVAICGTPRSGYYIAANHAELTECCEFLRSRAMHSLKLEARLRRVALPELVQQIRLDV